MNSKMTPEEWCILPTTLPLYHVWNAWNAYAPAQNLKLTTEKSVYFLCVSDLFFLLIPLQILDGSASACSIQLIFI